MGKKCSLGMMLALMLLSPMSAWGAPTGIQVTSEQHHVWGSAGSATQFTPGGTPGAYDVTSTSPLNVSVTGTYREVYGAINSLTASSNAGNFMVGAQGKYWFSAASAQSKYTFTPEVGINMLTFELTGSGSGVGIPSETNVWFTLDDVTTPTTMASVTAPQGVWWSTWNLDWAQTYSVQPTHTYVMTLFAHAGDGDDIRNASLQVDVLPAVPTPVPAPGAIVLCVLGAGSVHWLRRRRAL